MDDSTYLVCMYNKEFRYWGGNPAWAFMRTWVNSSKYEIARFASIPGRDGFVKIVVL